MTQSEPHGSIYTREGGNETQEAVFFVKFTVALQREERIQHTNKLQIQNLTFLTFLSNLLISLT